VKRKLIPLAALTFQPLLAVTYFANYQPSLDDANRVPTNDLWPGFIAPLDVPAEDSLGADGNYIGAWRPNQFSAFSYSSVATDFVATSSFTASHITFPALFSYSFANFDTLTGVTILEVDTTSGATASLGTTRVRVNTLRGYSPDYVDYTLPFGNNATGGPGGFSPTPVSIQEGNTYRIVFGGVPAGSAGGYVLRNSTTSGAATNTMVDYAPNSTDFQPAFALNDGFNSPVPEPSSVLLLTLPMFSVLRRRRKS